MRRYEQTCKSIRRTYFSWVYDGHWAVTETMALVWVYFDDAIWHPPLSAEIIEIMARTAYDLAGILKDTEFLRRERDEMLKRTKKVDAMEKQKGDKDEIFDLWEAEENVVKATSQHERDPLDLTSSSGADTPQALEAGTGQASETGTPQASEVDPELECEVTPELAEKPHQNIEEERQPPVDFEAKASHHVGAIVAATKPASVLPGRSQTDLEELILWELRRMPRHKIPEEEHRVPVTIRPTLFDNFPQLSKQGFGSTQYLKWKDAKAMAATGSFRSRATGWTLEEAKGFAQTAHDRLVNDPSQSIVTPPRWSRLTPVHRIPWWK